MFTDDIDDDVLKWIVRREREKGLMQRVSFFFSLFVWSKRTTCVPFLTACRVRGVVHVERRKEGRVQIAFTLGLQFCFFFTFFSSSHRKHHFNKKNNNWGNWFQT